MITFINVIKHEMQKWRKIKSTDSTERPSTSPSCFPDPRTHC